jgi:PAS domain S-box-containing protein
MTDGQRLKQKLIFSSIIESLTETGSDLIGVIDLNGNYTYVSPSCEHILGYSPDQFIGRNAFEFIHPDDIPKSLTALSNISGQNKVHLEPFRFLNAKGEWRWIETVATNQLDNSAIKGIVVNSRDITQKKVNDELLRHLAILAKQAIISIIISDSDQNIVWVNESFQSMYGYKLRDIQGKNFINLLSGKGTEQEKIEALQLGLKEKRTVMTEITLFTSKGIKRCIQLQVQPVFDKSGKLINYFSLHHDIGEIRTLQQQLLFDKEKFQNDISEAVIAAQEKERSIISQELHDNVSQLLSTAKLYLEYIQKHEGNSNPMLIDAMEIIDMSIREIREISHALSYSILKNDSLQDSLNFLIGQVNRANKTNITLEIIDVNDSFLSCGFKLAIYRIVQEQINNILKHSEAANAIVRLHQKGGKLQLEINDNGIGFDSSLHARGVGFKNIRSRADSYGGKVDLKTSAGNGCNLTIVFTPGNEIK